MLTLQIGISNKGLTLLEMIIVLFLFTFALSISFPLFLNLEISNLKTEAQRMASIIRYLNDNAAAYKRIFRLKFNFSKKIVQWEELEGWKEYKFKYLQDINLFSKGKINEGEIILFFKPIGNLEIMKIHFSNKKQILTVFWQGISGKIKILHGYQ